MFKFPDNRVIGNLFLEAYERITPRKRCSVWESQLAVAKSPSLHESPLARWAFSDIYAMETQQHERARRILVIRQIDLT